MSEDYPEPPRTDNLELALLSEAEDAEDYRDLWGAILDDEVFKKLETKLTEGEGDLDVASLSTEEAQINSKEVRPSMSEIYSEHYFKESTSTDDPLVIDDLPQVNDDTVGRHIVMDLHMGHVEGSRDSDHTGASLRLANGDDGENYEYYNLRNGELNTTQDGSRFALGGIYNEAPVTGRLRIYPDPRSGASVLGPVAGFGSSGIGSLSGGTFISGTYRGSTISWYEGMELWCGDDSGSVFADVSVFERDTVKEA